MADRKRSYTCVIVVDKSFGSTVNKVSKKDVEICFFGNDRELKVLVHQAIKCVNGGAVGSRKWAKTPKLGNGSCYGLL
jgi:hypothetical protein